MKIDHMLVRASCICPLCRNHKDVGCVVCWSCNRKEKNENHGAYSNTAETILDAREHRLELIAKLERTMPAFRRK